MNNTCPIPIPSNILETYFVMVSCFVLSNMVRIFLILVESVFIELFHILKSIFDIQSFEV